MTVKKKPKQKLKRNQPPKPNFWGAGNKPIAIAHRGGAGLYSLDRFRRENTLEVFRAAKDMGYEYLELDVTSTSDGKVIVMHVTTDRFEAILHKPSAPNAKKIQELSHYDLKARLNRDIPTLGQILKEFPDTKFLIDSKTDEVVKPLAQEIIKAEAYGRVYLNSFYLHRVARLQELLGNKVTYGLIIGRYPEIVNRKLKALKKGEYVNAGLTAVVVPHRFINTGLIDLIHKQGLKALVWTPNTMPQINQALAVGADGIISDNTPLLHKLINQARD
jgi:glycerophosphoryl diester phosphodiesterase